MLKYGLRCGCAPMKLRSLLGFVTLAPAGRQQLQRQPAAAKPPAFFQCKPVTAQALFNPIPQQLRRYKLIACVPFSSQSDQHV